MTFIDASQRLALLLRTQVPAFRAQQGRMRGKAQAAEPSADQPSDLAGVVAQRIQALAANDPDRKRKALRIFLESLLLQQLGPQLLHDSSFSSMVDAVQGQIQADPETASAAEALSDLLVRGGARP
ncbi:hypothetical protein [Ramlibacter humi]|uniref:Uncharacterized protein n=1 Tax=Ramlibacter humi TaxID=2530451 RepID=A0A4Z0BEG3_9BURK|nr:hypothetical protein [Ramlibacter humi]TFY97071.1 hypothetical protein EZ216_19615 [Ramlibacter humi]